MIVRRGERALGGIAAAMALLAGTLALTGIALGGAAIGPVPHVAGRPLLDVAGLVVACSWTAVGVSLILLRADHLAGWVFAVCGMAIAGSTAAQVYGATGLNQRPAWPGAAWVVPLAGLWITPFVLVTTVLLLSYPHGRIEGRTAAWLARAALVGLVALTIGYGASPGTYQDVTPAPPPFTLPSLVTATLLFVGALLVLPAMAGSIGWTIVRLIRARGPERQHLAWMTCVVLVFVAVFLNPIYSLPSWVETGSAIGLPVALGVGIFRHNLVTLEGVMRGGLTYGALTVAVITVYLAFTATLGAMAKDSPVPGVLAASLAAVGLTPARARVHALVDRFLFGERKDPLRAVSAVGGQLALTDQTDLLPAVLTRIVEALRSPGAIVTSDDGTVLAQQGTLGTRLHDVSLRVGGEKVGTLQLATRSVGDRFDAHDQQLLDLLGPQLAVVVRALDLAESLERARDSVLRAGHAERDRLRRDLHDGIGPGLSGASLGLAAAHDALQVGDTATAGAVLDRLRQELAMMALEVRRVIDDLRPPALDHAAGLGAALRSEYPRTIGRTALTLELREPLPPLGSDVETAAYRITRESVTNALRHAGADHVDVLVMSADDALTIEVRDDGHGIEDHARPGVGLNSLHHRAETVGGTLDITSGPTGTVVKARLPVMAHAGGDDE